MSDTPELATSPFGIRPHERVDVIVDGPSFYATGKNLGFEADFKKLREHLDAACDLRRCHYFTAMIENDDRGESPIKPLVDWLGYNGWRVFSKTFREYTDEAGRRRVKGSLNVEIALEMIEIAPKVDHILLFSGDGELRYAVDKAQRLGPKITVVSSLKTPSVAISDDLRRQADRFVDLNDVQEIVTRRAFKTGPMEGGPGRTGGENTLRLGGAPRRG